MFLILQILLIQITLKTYSHEKILLNRGSPDDSPCSHRRIRFFRTDQGHRSHFPDRFFTDYPEFLLNYYPFFFVLDEAVWYDYEVFRKHFDFASERYFYPFHQRDIDPLLEQLDFPSER